MLFEFKLLFVQSNDASKHAENVYNKVDLKINETAHFMGFYDIFPFFVFFSILFFFIFEYISF